MKMRNQSSLVVVVKFIISLLLWIFSIISLWKEIPMCQYFQRRFLSIPHRLQVMVVFDVIAFFVFGAWILVNLFYVTKYINTIAMKKYQNPSSDNLFGDLDDDIEEPKDNDDDYED